MFLSVKTGLAGLNCEHKYWFALLRIGSVLGKDPFCSIHRLTAVATTVIVTAAVTVLVTVTVTVTVTVSVPVTVSATVVAATVPATVAGLTFSSRYSHLQLSASS